MSPLTRAFIRASLIYFALGWTLGAALLLHPGLGPVIWYPHVHLNLVGAFGMIIFGVAYHVLPRFSGRPLHSERLGLWHLWLANAGLVGLALLLPLSRITGNPLLELGAKASGVVLLLSVYLFVYNLWKTVFGPPLWTGFPPPGPPPR